MTFRTLWLFVPACFALNMAFGPNNLLSLTHGARSGLSRATLAGLGRLLAFAAMILLAALGLGAALAASELVFAAVKWAGVVYLLWIGWGLIRHVGDSAPAVLAGDSTPLGAMARREFLVAAGNPKAILIFTAFFPQFVDPDAYLASFLLLGVVFLVLEGVAIVLYGLAGAHGRPRAAAGATGLDRPAERRRHGALRPGPRADAQAASLSAAEAPRRCPAAPRSVPAGRAGQLHQGRP